MEDLHILYEDAHLVLCVKPVGVLSEDSEQGACMPALLRRHYREQGKPDYIATVHRLDKIVGGVMLFSRRREVTEEELLCVAASVEQPSEHPLSRAVTEAADERSIPLCDVADFTAVPGGGVQALLHDRTIYAGNAPYMQEKGVDIAPFAPQAGRWADDGKTVLYFAEEGRLLGLIAVADTVKPDSAAAIAALKQRGCRVVLLTGDNARTDSKTITYFL